MATPFQPNKSFIAGPLNYLALSFLTMSIILAAVVVASYFLKWQTSLTQNGALVTFQQDKIDRRKFVDTIFVGDSSLGNAIDSAEFDSLTGSKSLNLALSGNFGYAGSYNMIRRAVIRHPELRNVVIMQTLDVITRHIPYHSYVLSSPDLRIFDLGSDLRWPVAAAFVSELLDWHTFLYIPNLLRGEKALVFDNDYVRQDPDHHPQVNNLAPMPPVNPLDTRFLREIAGLCRGRRLNCFYAHGPLLEGIINNSKEQLEETNIDIRENGLRLALDRPMPIPSDRIGDSEDHVAPPFKSEATHYYAQRLKIWLVAK